MACSTAAVFGRNAGGIGLLANRHPLANDRHRPAQSRSTTRFGRWPRRYPEVSPMRELRSALSEMRLADLAVGSDGRNRTILSAFRSRTGRCQPSNTKYIFGPSVWLRGLIKPPEGWGVAYLDWCQQEHSHCRRAVRRSRRCRPPTCPAIPIWNSPSRRAPCRPTPPSNPRRQRELFKQCVLARGLWHGSQEPGAADRQARDRRPRSAAITPRNLSQVLGMVRRHRRSRDAAASRCRPCSAGRSELAAIQTRARCETFPARPTAPRCCGWPPASPPSRASKSAP